MTKYKLDRDGDLPLAFCGALVGAGSTQDCRGPTQNRWTEVNIYRTTRGSYVAEVRRISLWQGEDQGRTAAVLETAEAVIAWLRFAGAGQLGRASLGAIERATDEDAAFAAAGVEETP